jgi:NADPH:quinone reductase-like Zn-dependent oxidoreductase
MGVRSVEYRFTRVQRHSPLEADDLRTEFAGRVEEVGAAVTEFRVGDSRTTSRPR